MIFPKERLDGWVGYGRCDCSFDSTIAAKIATISPFSYDGSPFLRGGAAPGGRTRR